MTPARLEVLSTPTEFSALTPARLAHTVCVVFDVLRATTSIVTALAHGARTIRPLAGIAQAVTFRQQHPEALLAGERHGWRIRPEDSGGIEFDFGNSPREFTTSRVRGSLIAITTTNGTRALESTAGAQCTLVASFLNLSATASALRQLQPDSLLLIGAGSYEEAALEDTLAAGALCDALWDQYHPAAVADSATIARLVYLQLKNQLSDAFALGRNGRRLLEHPELRADVAFASQSDRYPLVAQLEPDGFVRPKPLQGGVLPSVSGDRDAPA